LWAFYLKYFKNVKSGDGYENIVPDKRKKGGRTQKKPQKKE